MQEVYDRYGRALIRKAERILRNYDLSPQDSALVVSSSGCNRVPIEMAEEFRRRGVRVVPSALGGDAPLLGAAELALEAVLSDPLDTLRKISTLR